MSAVGYTRENIAKCWCGQCPVQVGSRCVDTLYSAFEESGELPPPQDLGGMYCSTGKAVCTDLVLTNLCNCPACVVWAENRLSSNHYCVFGSAG